MKNWVNRFLLAVLLVPSALYRRFGVDLVHLKAILQAKLNMDDRRAGSLYRARNQKKDKEFNLATLMTMVACLVMGGILLVSFVFSNDITRLTAYFTLYIFLIALFLIADFTDVLIDSKDNYIILPKPVSSGTILVARLLHIVIHVSKICIPMAFPMFIGMWITRGIMGALLLMALTSLITMLTIFLVNAVYLVIIRIFSPDKFKSIIASVQIGFTVIVFATYQLLPRLIDTDTMLDIDISGMAIWWLDPGFWFANAWKQLYSLQFNAAHFTGLLLSLTVPFISLWLMVKKLAPAFQQKITLIGSGSTSEKEIARQKLRKEGGKIGFFTRIATWLTQPGVERAGFLFVWQMMGRSKEFKIRVYPQYGYLLVFVILMFFTGNKAFGLRDLGDPNAMRKLSMVFIYASGFMYMSALQQLPFTKQFRAAWLFFVTPFSAPGLFLRGAAKAMIVKFAFPALILIGVAGTIVIGVHFLPNLLLGFGNLMLVNAVVSLMTFDKLPFSVPTENAASSEITFKSILRMTFLPLLGIPHYFIYNYTWIVFLAGLTTATLAFFVLRSLREVKWKDIDPLYE